MIDQKHIGHAFPTFRTTVEAGRVRLFCKAIGETSSIHSDADVARSFGYRNILAPITFATALAMDNPNPRCVIELVGVDIAWILHGEEHYSYFNPVCVADEIEVKLKITDIFDKKGGALEFVVMELDMVNQLGERVCTVRRSLVVRRPAATAAAVS
jgi:acyl dehydratase